MPRSVAPAVSSLVALAVIASLGACSDDGGSAPASSADVSATLPVTSVSVATPPVVDVVPSGFDTTAATILAPDGQECVVCLWVADTDTERQRGLMEVTALDGAAGMAFVYDPPRTGAFTMRNTVMPLSIAFFGVDGGFLHAFDMEPCIAEPCPSYPTPENFSVAVEVPQGDLDQLDIGPGSVLALGVPAGATVCDRVGSGG